MTNRPAGGLLGASIAVGVGIAGWSIFNFVFFILAGNLLGPEKYGLVAALLAVVVTAFIPMSALQAGAARPFAVGSEEAPALYRRALVRVTGGIFVALIIAIGVLGIIRLIHPTIPFVLLLLAMIAIVPMAPLFLA